MPTEMITVDSASKTFVSTHGVHVDALQGVSFSVREGEFVSIVGPSGCGKSTMLSIIAGLEAASAGTVSVAGEQVAGSRADVSVVFQDAVLLPWRRVIDNVLLPAELRGRICPADRAKAGELIEMVGLGGFENSYPKELSGGMQQRCAIARALMVDARLLLMDEPFGALDALTREQMNLEIEEIWAQTDMTALLITHDINEAVLLSDRILVMSSRPGRIARVLSVPAPRPRSIGDLQDPDTAEVALAIRRELGVDRPNRRRPRPVRPTSGAVSPRATSTITKER